MYGALEVSTSALVAHRTNLDVIAGNIAMKEGRRVEGGESVPYRRRVALFAAGRADGAPGVRVTSVVEDPTPFGLRWDPKDPDAIKSGEEAGYVRVSNVDYHTEMVNAMVAARAYEANLSVMEMSKSMGRATLRLIA
jgi:flagellar basal-body rod protein FlgC